MVFVKNTSISSPNEIFWDETDFLGTHHNTVNNGIDKNFLLSSANDVVELGEDGIFYFCSMKGFLCNISPLRISFKESRNSI